MKKENEELKKNFDQITTAVNSFFKKPAPARKAITEIDFVKKSEEAVVEKPLTKSEVKEILAKKVQDPKLSSADRKAINEFYLNDAGVEKIKHLLNTK